MAGVKGKSGGPRKNSGGARPGAGRKPKAKPVESAKVGKGAAVEVTREPQPQGGALKRNKAKTVPVGEMDMLAMLQAVALGKVEATTIQVRAAIAAVQYTHTKRGDGGKKEETAARSGKAAKGRFGVRPPPLKLVGKGG